MSSQAPTAPTQPTSSRNQSNMIFKACLSLSLCVAALAAGIINGGVHGGGGVGPNVIHPPAQYAYSYKVADEFYGTNFGHQESRDGPDTTGEYYVLLPDGRIQRVNYEVRGDSGYLADVTYEGEARPQPGGPGPVHPGPTAPLPGPTPRPPVPGAYAAPPIAG